jgi:hypothetical protein
MKGIYDEKYSSSNPIVLDFQKLLGDQVPTTKAIKRDPKNLLQVYNEILKYLGIPVPVHQPARPVDRGQWLKVQFSCYVPCTIAHRAKNLKS